MDNPTMKILFAKMLIPDGGVLSQLNRQISYYDEETDGYQDWHYMVLVISYGEKASKLILDLIQQVIEIFPLLPARESREMEDALVKYLANWAESSITTPNAMNEIVEFLGAVLANVPSLRKAFEAQIKAWTEDKRLRYKTLAAAVENHWVKEELALKQKKQVNISQWDI